MSRVLVNSLLLTLISSAIIGAEGEELRSVGRLPSVLPRVPLQQGRPLQGPDEELLNEARESRDPVSSFIFPNKGNDAAIEVIVGQGRLLSTRKALVTEAGDALIAVGDPTVIDIDVMPDPRMIRIIGRRAGVSDLSVTTSDGEVFNFEVHVLYDLQLLSAQIRQLFPDADVRLAQIREHLVVEGQARSTEQTNHIIQTLTAYLKSVQVPSEITSETQRGEGPPGAGSANGGGGGEGEGETEPRLGADPGRDRPDVSATFAEAQIINLLRVPGVHQVLLKVRVAELNRTALRSIGSDWFLVGNNSAIGTQIGGAQFVTDDDGFIQALGLGNDSTIFGVFSGGDFTLVMEALRRNGIISLLAEPNLMAMSGQQATFLAGGQFPVPVPQGGGISNNVTIEFKDFGVRLDFLPVVLDDETIRLKVEPEVSSIDPSIGTTLVAGGDPVPGVNTRKASTTVELRQGQTLAVAGLLQVDLEAQTNRIPGLGDLPVLGTFFSNTSNQREEKELIVLVTPYLVAPVEEHEVAPLPGAEIHDPTDLELYLLGRIEGRTGREFRSTTAWDDPWGIVEKHRLEQQYGSGPLGFSE